MGNSLIAYFSCTGNTHKIADTIAKLTGGTLYAITPEKPYTAEDLNWEDPMSRSSLEKSDWSIHPDIKGEKPTLAGVDTVFLGFPIWWDTAPNIITTFLEDNDLKGKTIAVFCTSGSSNPDQVAPKLEKSLDPSTKLLPAIRFTSDTTEAEIQAWINEIK